MNRRWRGWSNWLLGGALVLALVLTVVFTVRAGQHIPRLRTSVDEPIRPWMTVGYVAHSYHVPPPILFGALGLPARPPDRRTIRQIAQAQNRSVSEVTAVLQHAIAQGRPPKPPTTQPRSTP